VREGARPPIFRLGAAAVLRTRVLQKWLPRLPSSNGPAARCFRDVVFHRDRCWLRLSAARPHGESPFAAFRCLQTRVVGAACLSLSYVTLRGQAHEQAQREESAESPRENEQR
jgi:hypothetical protein